MAVISVIKSNHKSSILKLKKKKDKRKKRREGLRLRCPLCSKSAEIARVSMSACGHVFCTRCLRAAQAQNVACPTCGQKIMKRKRRYQDRFNPLQLIYLIIQFDCSKRIDGPKVIKQVPNELCGLKKPEAVSSNGRRGADFSIVGAHQVCNHTCPTYCVDIYDPVCGQMKQNIYKKDEDGVMKINSRKRLKQIFTNHCHVDLLSCTTGMNITIVPTNFCYRNSQAMIFMSEVAGLKSLGLLDEGSYEAKLNAARSGIRN